MDAGHEPTAPMSFPNLPPPVTSSYPNPPGPTAVLPIVGPGPGGPSGGARPPARWTGGAKAAVALLAVTTLAGVGFGVSQFTRANDRSDEVDRLEREVDDLGDDLDDAAAELDDANAAAAAVQAQLDTTGTDLAAMTARRDALAAVFPVTAAVLAATPPGGSWGLVNSPQDCEGFSDEAASCVANNFPTDIVIDGSSDVGYTASSAWYAPIPLTFDGARWTGSGTLAAEFSNTCGGEVNATTVSLDFGVTGVWGDDTSGLLNPAEVSGTVALVSGETATCVGATRTAAFVTAAG